MRETSCEIESAPDATPSEQIRSRVDMMYAEGDELVGRFNKGATKTQARKDLGLLAQEADLQTARDLVAAWQQWDIDARTLIQEAEAAKHPLLVAEALTARLTVIQGFLASERMVASVSATPWRPDHARCETLIGEVKHAREVFLRAGSWEGETRVKLLLADYHYLLGERNIAKALAEEALVVAQAMGYFRLEEHAREYTEGPTNFEQFEARIAAQRAQDQDEIHANYSDERLKEFAQHCVDTMRLPTDRLPVLMRECQSARLIALERLHWCRHINLMQDKWHMLHPDTRFLTDPPRFCVCEKHKHEAKIRYPDTQTVINAFKRAYCDECPDRSPKRPGGDL